MNFHITHSTRYSYSAPVGLCWNQACLLPRETANQKCLSSELQICPPASGVRERSDFFGNRVTHFAIQNPHKELLVTANSDISITPDPELLLDANLHTWDELKILLATEKDPVRLQAIPFLFDSPMIPRTQALADYALPSFQADRPLVEAVRDLMERIYRDFTYDPAGTTIATPLAEVLKNRRGVCQDFAHLGVGCLRSMGLAARYVSGYIETLPAPGKERLVGAAASHAWFSVYAGEAGWVDFDPTNNQIPLEQHITVAWGRDFSDVSPLRGVALGGGKHRVSVSVDVARAPTKIVNFQFQSQ
ncbi:transglutaminase family protein [Geopsychrobacter electrodiphilus]|uniref:transglutaminase family protein n=1 Tax=Geopsychrobacter electrodiphilus TaxID=225196 RepID=UPI00037AE86F|nr:transglutaminase family protein [Geopsychrobacter electrodiphilus]